MRLSIDDLSDYGRDRLDNDCEQCDRRGKKAAKDDFAEGWMALALRHKLWSYFTAGARQRLEAV